MGKSFDNEQGMEIEMEFHHRMSFDQASQANSSGRWEHGLPLSSDNLGLSKCFKVTVIAVSVIIMLVVILCFTFVLPRSEKKERSTLEIASTSGNIGLVCQATRYPDVCFTSLESDSHSSEANSSDILKIAIHVASTGVTDSLREASQILENFRSNVNISAAARDCKEVLSYSLNWLQECMNADVTTNVNDIQAWLSAALTYQNDCNSSLTYVNTTDSINQAMIQVHSVIPLISNALSMADAYASYGSDPVNWKPPASGREVSSLSSWNWQIHHERHLSDALEPSAVVSQDSSGAFNSIQDAVDKAPDNSRSIYVIHIREGTYHEIIRIPQCKTRLMFLGDGIGKTIITGDLSVQQPGINTMDSATIVVSGAEFIAQDLTIQNTAGPEAYQAVALRVDSDRSAFHRVAVLGYQDSLYAHTLRQFYRDCLIEGTIDFIFGNSAAIFQNCSIRVRVGRQGVADSTVTAHGRTDPAQTTGLVFLQL
ncbi:hypothetical protein O6H91_Y571600 [Diphasiastrum complanatum]|nr:hypothetical protein O6H91_Y571600 [Diphasiastrum complanatum]